MLLHEQLLASCCCCLLCYIGVPVIVDFPIVVAGLPSVFGVLMFKVPILICNPVFDSIPAVTTVHAVAVIPAVAGFSCC
jgi:hypothetical protein